MNISEKIKKIRTEKHLTQQEFADKILVSRRSVMDWEHEKYQPQSETIKNICKVFKIPVSFFFDDDKENLMVNDLPLKQDEENSKKDEIYNSIPLDWNEVEKVNKECRKEFSPSNRFYFILWGLEFCFSALFISLSIWILYLMWLLIIPFIFIGVYIQGNYNKKHRLDFFNFHLNKLKGEAKNRILLSPVYPLYFSFENDQLIFYVKNEVRIKLSKENIYSIELYLGKNKINGLLPEILDSLCSFVVIVIYNQKEPNKVFVPFVDFSSKEKIEPFVGYPITKDSINKIRCLF